MEDGKLMLLKDVLNSMAKHSKAPKTSIININEVDDDNSTIIVLALRHRHFDIARFLLKTFNNKLDLNIRNKKQQNAIILTYKSQEFDLIDLVLAHHSVNSSYSHLLNCIIPAFEKNPTENAKYMVKLILEKGMDPNKLNHKYLNKDASQKMFEDGDDLPDKIFDTCAISLACSKFQNNALNFIIKYNSTIREILAIHNLIRNKHNSNVKFDLYFEYARKLDASKKSRVLKFLTYIEDISRIQKQEPMEVI